MAVILRTAAVVGGAAMSSPGISQMWWIPGTVGGSTADATDCLARFRASWNSHAAFINNQITLTFDPVCLAIEATTGVLTGSFVGTTPLSVTGTIATDALPRQTQGLVRLGTSSVIGGRRVRGRLFIPGPCEANNTVGGLPDSGYVSSLTSSFASVLTPGATASSPAIWHRPQGGAGGAGVLITSVGGSPTWSVLRSRRG